MKVPFLDLNAQNESIKEELLAGIQAVLDCSAFAGVLLLKPLRTTLHGFASVTMPSA